MGTGAIDRPPRKFLHFSGTTRNPGPYEPPDSRCELAGATIKAVWMSRLGIHTYDHEGHQEQQSSDGASVLYAHIHQGHPSLVAGRPSGFHPGSQGHPVYDTGSPLFNVCHFPTLYHIQGDSQIGGLKMTIHRTVEYRKEDESMNFLPFLTFDWGNGRIVPLIRLPIRARKERQMPFRDYRETL